MGKKGANRTAVKAETILDVVGEDGRVLTMIEVDPADENPALLDAIRYVRTSTRSTLTQVVAHTHAHDLDGDGERGGLSLAGLPFDEIRWGFGAV
jgi:hypothetical protein